MHKPAVHLCEECGATFEGRKRKFCYSCLVEHKQDPKLYSQQYRALYRQDITCVDCGKAVRALPGTKRCRGCYKSRGPVPKPCQKCGSLFTPTQKGVGSRTFCSEECASVPCLECGALAVPRNWRGSLCSEDCRKARQTKVKRQQQRRRRVRRKGSIRGAYHDLEVFDRDGWICQLCGDRVEPWQRVPHLKAPTIDHILPVAEGGNDVAENVQCAHFVCNSRKGMRVVPPLSWETPAAPRPLDLVVWATENYPKEVTAALAASEPLLILQSADKLRLAMDDDD